MQTPQSHIVSLLKKRKEKNTTALNGIGRFPPLKSNNIYIKEKRMQGADRKCEVPSTNKSYLYKQIQPL